MGVDISLHDVCVFIPAGFGAVATILTALLAWECTDNSDAAVATAFFMSILPAHLMRSVAGGFDNESIAISAIVGTFYLWTRSLRTPYSWPIGLLAGIMYTYMVAAWGGYVFVLNMIGIHAGILCLLGRFSSQLHHAYSLWFLVGTAGAVLGPARYLVGWQPFQSMEQLGPLGVFGGLQLLMICQMIRKRWPGGMNDEQYMMLRMVAFGAAALAASIGLMFLPEGFIGPLSARVRGLFIKHTKTGNPLVDSVAEHQATPTSVYWQYYHFVALAGPIGFVASFFSTFTDAKIFLLTYSLVGAYFSAKMIRLVLLLSPGACVCAGAFIATAIDVTIEAYGTPIEGEGGPSQQQQKAAAAAAPPRPNKPGQPPQSAKPKVSATGKPLTAREQREAARARQEERPPSLKDDFEELRQIWDENVEMRRSCGSGSLLFAFFIISLRFLPHCWRLAEHLSEPQIMLRGKPTETAEGGGKKERVIIDDFREAYWWLRDNTPEDARVMAWWDYGYQINGVGNRTTIADGNTWNHEHIALLGKCLTSSEKVSHAITRHLADYVLIWTTRYAGMYADDLAKSPHMARIGTSVYGDRIGCHASQFYMERDGTPSDCMRESILWRMHQQRFDETIEPLELFEEAYTTKHRMVRIYKVLKVSEESKAWRAAKGIECASEECYPPELASTLALKESFQQIHGLLHTSPGPSTSSPPAKAEAKA